MHEDMSFEYHNCNHSKKMYRFISTLPHPRWQHGEVEEDSTVPLVEWQFFQLGDGFQWSECLIYGNSHTDWAVGQLLLDVVCFAITWRQEWERNGGGRGKREGG